MRTYTVAMTVVTEDGVSPYVIDLDAPGAWDAESEAHLIATQGEGLTVLTVDSVEEVISAS